MKKVKITTIILAIILITLIAFAGVYLKTQNRMENKVKGYTLGRELKGGRVIKAVVSDNQEDKEQLKEENYNIVKRTIEERMNNLGVEDYIISLNKEDGTIVVELGEDVNTDIYAYFVTADSKVEIKEKDAEIKLLNDSMVKKSSYTYTANAQGEYQAYMEIYLTDEGQAKIEEIQKNYAILANEVEEIEAAQEDKEEKEEEKETKTENAEETRKIAILTVAGNEYDIDKIEKNKIVLKIGGETTSTASINNNMAVAAELTMLINSGKYPVNYEIEENRFISSDITEQQMIYLAIIAVIILFIVFIILTIRYKMNGLLVSFATIGFISILSLILRYTNVNISIEGIGAIILVLIINFRINHLVIREKTDNIDIAFIETYKKTFLKLVPIIIITLVFCFTGISNINSFGMIMFWGLLLIAIYNAIVTKTLLKLKENQ